MPIFQEASMARSNKLFKVATFIIGAFLTTKIFAQNQAEESIVVLFGDSITVGENVTSYYTDCGANQFGSPEDRAGRPRSGKGRTDFCNPDRELEKILDESHRPSTVVNYGIGGSLTGLQSGNGLSRISSNLNQTRSNYPNGKDYFVLILYGTNDVSFGVSPGTIGFNVSRMIDRARDAGFTPVVGNLLPRSFLNVVPANIRIQDFANALGANFVNQYDNFQANGGNSVLHDDETIARISERLHPNAAGYRVVAQHWFDAALKDLIDPVAPVVAPIIQLLFDEEE